MENSGQKVFVVLNPKSGNVGNTDEVRAELEQHFLPPAWTAEIYEITGQEDVAAISRAACERGASLVVAAGGDGTLLSVANGLVHSPVPLGILPLGTGNDLARALLVPLKLTDAIQLLVSDRTAIKEVDALQVGDRFFFSNVSVGISPQMMNATRPEEKKRLGRLAYILPIIKRADIFRLKRFNLSLDGKSRSIRAAEVLISNPTLLEKPPFIFGPPETLDDGQMEIYLIMARTFGDYLRLLWDLIRRPGKSSAKMAHLAARQSVRIEAKRSYLVQGDGELIGHTPVEVKLVPKALRVIMPLPASSQPAVELNPSSVKENAG